MVDGQGHRHQFAHQSDDVGLGEGADVEVGVEPQAGVQLVPAHAGEVVALGIEADVPQQVAARLERGRLARALLLEQFHEGFFDRADRVLVEGGLDERVAVEEIEDLLVGALGEEVGLVAGTFGIDPGQGAQEHGGRQLALAVDADRDRAPLVDLELQPGAAGRHEVGDEHLLRRVLGGHDVGARGPHQLGDDHPLGAVDDEGALLGHHGEVAHEDVLLADLARFAVDEPDGYEQRRSVGLVFIPAFLERNARFVELVLAEFDRVVARCSPRSG